ncbi:hypothetical protein F2Q69_00053878 [Brassica cretica]|uniref:Uncharacterized protein n=1 Tax=Brassica cretica TaxID=69181 RepID=A0A8S9N2R4_BRACR|nr:hypothetical protein F2Q69_00053878 [Brassica cretica]
MIFLFYVANFASEVLATHAITKLPLLKAKRYLEDVIAHKQAIPFPRPVSVEVLEGLLKLRTCIPIVKDFGLLNLLNLFLIYSRTLRAMLRCCWARSFCPRFGPEGL